MNALTTKSFYSILIKPVLAFKEIFSFQGKKSINSLILIGCIWQAISVTLSYGRDTTVWSSLIAQIFLSVTIGWLFFYLFAQIIYKSLNFFGGKGTYEDTKIISAWAFAPGIFSIALYITLIVFAGSDFINGGTAKNIFTYVNIILGIWSFYILVNGAVFTHKLSIAKSIAGIILPFFIFYLVLFSLTFFI